MIRLFLIRAAGESHGDSSAELWSMYFSKNKKQGREKRDGWMEDRDDVLVFVSFGISSSFSPFKLLV